VGAIICAIIAYNQYHKIHNNNNVVIQSNMKQYMKQNAEYCISACKQNGMCIGNHGGFITCTT
jgi:hypothetical protein